MNTEKISENSIQVTSTETTVATHTFEMDYLLSQRDAIQGQKDRDNAQRDLELAQVNMLIDQCNALEVGDKIEATEVPTAEYMLTDESDRIAAIQDQKIVDTSFVTEESRIVDEETTPFTDGILTAKT